MHTPHPAPVNARARPSWRVVVTTLALAGSALIVAPAPGYAQSAETRYERTLARDHAARHAAKPSITSLRSIAKAYEAIVRRYPTSGYADNALWQGASLWQLAFERSKDTHDQSEARRLLAWLIKEYPASSLRARARAGLSPPRPATASAPPRATSAPVVPGPAVPPRPDRADATPDAPRPARPQIPEAPATTPAARHADASASADSSAFESVAAVSAPRASTPSPSGAEVIGITRSTLPKGDRVTIELSHEVPYSITRLSSPDRIVLELTNIGSPGSPDGRIDGVPGTFVTAVRSSPGGEGTVHVMLQLAGRVRFSTFPLYNPFRLAIDVEGDGTPQAAAVLGAPRDVVARMAADRPTRSSAETPAPAVASAAPRATTSTADVTPAPASITSQGDYSLARQLGLRVSRVVIDPGHGGHDPGAEAHGVREAEVVLDVALRLEKLLLAHPGIEVVLTRRSDEYIALDERTAVANRENADLFLSIHANASPRAATRGIETYFLNFASNPEAEAVAARENAASAQTMHTLPSLVKAIALNNKLAESRELAGLVQGSLFKRLTPGNKGFKSLGVKQAPFVVLIGAQMPSVLAEISFLTSSADASLLKQTTYRQRIAQGLCDAILAYQGSLKKIDTVASRMDPR